MKTGILGGSFDPVHLGHIALAEDAARQAGLHEIVMVPARVQPFKQDRKPASGEDRFRMLALVAGQSDRITASRYELQQESVSYTYLTMRAMQKQYGGQLYFICGADSFLKIESWMEAEELLESYSYIIGTRPGYCNDALERVIERVRRGHGTEVIHIENRQFDISSTEIRERTALGASISQFVSGPVERYIIEHGLYR